MTRIDFYVLPSHDPHTRRVMACKLVEKAYRQGHTVYLKTDTEEESRVFDDLLWTFRQGSFVPHEMAGPSTPEAPVIIGHLPAPEAMRDVMVNLCQEVPQGYTSFERLAELVDQDESIRSAGRRRYRHYQAEGHSIQTHQLDKN